MLQLNSIKASWTTFVVLTVSVFSFIALSLPTHAATLGVSPIVECVISRDLDADGLIDIYTAVMGYNNPNADIVSITAGSTANRFNPTPALRSQPTDFQPGRHYADYSYNFYSGNQVWTLQTPGLSGKTATATTTTKACSASVVANFPYDPSLTF